MDIKIEKGVPLSERKRDGMTNVLRQMEIGDSFLAPARPTALGTYHFHNLAKNIGIKISMRTTEDGLRVWRIA